MNCAICGKPVPPPKWGHKPRTFCDRWICMVTYFREAQLRAWERRRVRERDSA